MSTKERFYRTSLLIRNQTNSDTFQVRKSKNVSEYLVKELTQIGIADAYLDQYGYVYAFCQPTRKAN